MLDQDKGTDWNAVGAGCQQLGCALMLLPIVGIVIVFVVLLGASGC